MPVQLIKDTNNNDSPILAGLNDMQRQAVCTTDGPLLVIAGAGSGKTRVLTHRVAYLMEQGIKPWNILALTFTNKAAGEMKERIASIISAEAAHRVTAGTFHSVFARLLRYDADKIGYTSSFSIYDTDDSLSTIRRIMQSMGIKPQKNPPQGFRSRISWAKNQMINWRDYGDSAESPVEKMTASIYEAYEAKLKSSNAMDFDDLLLNMIKLLNNSPETLKKLRNWFKYILVDEYQDTNRAQYLAINLLAGGHHNICVVGDDAQSIYRWRGAEIKNILDFQKDYPEAKTVRLEQNYRSTKTILAAASSVISHNRRQLPKELWTENPEGEKIDVIPCLDDRMEAEMIVQLIKEQAAKHKLSQRDIAVLYRTNAQSMALENSFRNAKLQYIVIGGISFYMRKEIKDTISYLKLLNNPSDDAALFRIVNEPPRGLGQTSLNHLRDFATAHNISTYQAFKMADQVPKLQARARKAANLFVELVDKYITESKEGDPGKVVLDYIDSTGMTQLYKEMDTEESLDRFNNVQQFLSDITNYFKTEQEASLDNYLQQISLITDLDKKDTKGDHIKLMTLHAAKGLEFPYVFIAGMEQGLFPLGRVEMDPEEEEEERRLFYVGITRAEQKLYITYAKRRMKFGEVNYQAPSEFLTELPKECLRQATINRKRKDTNAAKPRQATKPKPRFPGGPAKEQPLPESTNLKQGVQVEHPTFGPGRVEVVTGSGDSTKVLVTFESVGRKVLMLKFAKLTVID